MLGVQGLRPECRGSSRVWVVGEAVWLARQSKIIGRNFVLETGIFCYRKRPPAFHCWEPFPKIPLQSLNRALRIPAASAPGGLPVRPPQPLTDPQGGHWKGHTFLRNSLVYFFSSLMRCCVRRPFYHQLPGQLAAFQPWGCQEKAAWRGDAAHVSFLGTFCWGRSSECACSLAQAEERWWREAVHAGTSSIAKQNVALAAPWWLGQGWEALVLGSPWSQCLPWFRQTMTLLTANSLDGNIFVPGIFPNLKFTGTFSSNILSFCKN